MELETLRSDMIAAMKAKDKARKEANLFPDLRSKESSHRRGLPR